MRTIFILSMIFFTMTTQAQLVREYDFSSKTTLGKNKVKYGESIDLIINNINPFRYNIKVKSENGFFNIPINDSSKYFLNKYLGSNSLGFLKEHQKQDSIKKPSMASFVDTMDLIIQLKKTNLELISLKYSNLTESFIKNNVEKLKEELEDESVNFSRIIKLPGVDSLLFDNYKRIFEILNTSFSYSYNTLCESDFVKIDVNFIDRIDTSAIIPSWRNRILGTNQFKFYTNFGIGIKFIQKDYQYSYFLRGDTIDFNEKISKTSILQANLHCQYSSWEMFNFGINFNLGYQINNNSSSPLDIGLGLDFIFGDESKLIITPGFITSFNDYKLNPGFKVGDRLPSSDSKIPLVRKTTINPIIGFSINLK